MLRKEFSFISCMALAEKTNLIADNGVCKLNNVEQQTYYMKK